jgi:alpha-L-fucosidase 2
MLSLSSAAAALLASTCFFPPAQAAEFGQPESSSNPWRIWDDRAGGGGTFSENYPVGNGRLGIMTSGDPRSELVRINENSFWSGSLLHRVNPDSASTVSKMQQLIRDGEYLEAEDLGIQGYAGTPLSTRHYDKMGNLKLTQMLPDGEVTGYERWLGVDDAVAGVYFSAGNVSYHREYLASYEDDIVAIHVKGSKPGSVNLRVKLDRGSDLNRYQGFGRAANGHTTVMGGQSMDAHPLHWAAGARIVSSSGKVSTLGDTVRCEGADEATVYFQAWTSYRKHNPTEAVISDLAAVSKGFDTIRKAHVEDYQHYAGRVSLSLGASTAAQKSGKTSTRMTSMTPDTFDPELATLFFQFGRYLFIASSRPGSDKGESSLPPNLQGVWNDVYNPMWGSKYTLNINLRMAPLSAGMVLYANVSDIQR